MPFDFQRARPLLHSGALAKLFVEELGWKPCRQSLTLRAGEADYAFTAVAELGPLAVADPGPTQDSRPRTQNSPARPLSAFCFPNFCFCP